MAYEGGAPISSEGFSIKGFGNSISPDGRFVAAIDSDKRAWILPTDGGEGKPIDGMEPGEVPLQFSSDGRSLCLVRGGEVPGKIWRLDLATGKRDFVLELTLPQQPLRPLPGGWARVGAGPADACNVRTVPLVATPS